MPDFLELSKNLQGDIVAWRRALHRIPETGFEELKTLEFVSEKLASFGYRVKKGVARTGVVAEYGTGSPVIALRAEMDGYPVQEELMHPFASIHMGIMHACGHDVNMALVLGAARILGQLDLRGTVKVIMQPSSEKVSEEDNKSGSNKMLEEGVLDGLDALLSVHVDATIGSGSAGVLSNRQEGRLEEFSIELFPASQKPSSNDTWHAMQAASLVVSSLIDSTLDHQTFKDLLVVESILPASKSNGFEKAEIRGNFTSLGRDTYTFFDGALKAACEVAIDRGGQYELNYSQEKPRLINCDTAVNTVQKAGLAILGESNSRVVQRKAWSEDFYPFSSNVPSALIFLGVGVPSSPRILHTPTFDVDESMFYLGSALLCQAVVDLMKN